MRIEDSKGNQLNSLDDWENLHNSEKWKQGRSAHSIADFIVNRKGACKIQERISSILGESIEFLKIIPEHEIKFDKYKNGRVHDIGIFGETISGKSIFVGVEAKVDETFGKYIKDEWRDAEIKINRGKKTCMLQRIKELCAKFKNGSEITENAKIRYQLLHGTAGTTASCADISVFYVAVFLTELYNDSIGKSNYQDYRQFIEEAGGESTGFDGISHRLMIGGKPLISIYECFETN